MPARRAYAGERPQAWTLAGNYPWTLTGNYPRTLADTYQRTLTGNYPRTLTGNYPRDGQQPAILVPGMPVVRITEPGARYASVRITGLGARYARFAEFARQGLRFVPGFRCLMFRAYEGYVAPAPFFMPAGVPGEGRDHDHVLFTALFTGNNP